MDETTPHRVRQLVCDEMRVRYGVDFALEADMPVAAQEARLAEMVIWVRENQSKFVVGKWYFAGSPIGQ